MIDRNEDNQTSLISEIHQNIRPVLSLKNDTKRFYSKEGKTKELSISLPDPVPLQRGLYVTLSGNTTPSTVNTFGLEEGIDSFMIDTDDIGDDISCFESDELDELEYEFDYKNNKANIRSNTTSFETIVRGYSRSYIDCPNRNLPEKIDQNKFAEWRNVDYHRNINEQQRSTVYLPEAASIPFDHKKIHTGKPKCPSGSTCVIPSTVPGNVPSNVNFHRISTYQAKRKREEGKLKRASFNNHMRNKSYRSSNYHGIPYHLKEIDKIYQYHVSMIHDLERKLEEKESCIENLKNQMLIGQQTRKTEMEEYQNKVFHVNEMMLASKRKVFSLQKELDEYKNMKVKNEK